MNERFILDGETYKTVPVKDGEKHCGKCAFKGGGDCEYSPDIPDCDAEKREDR